MMPTMKIGMQRKHVNDNTPACISMRRRGARQNAAISIEYLCRKRGIGGEKYMDLSRLIGYSQVELTLY
jgi:hypothetical protein